MKKVFLFISLVMLASTVRADITYSAFAAIKITSNGGADAKVRVYENALFSATEKDTEYGEAAINTNEGSQYTHTVKFYAPCPWGNASEVCTNDIYGTTMTFNSNQIDADYVITFTAVGGTESKEMYLKDNVTGRKKLIAKNDTMKFSQAVNTLFEERFEIVSNELPFHPRATMTAGNWGTICYKEAITAVEGATIYAFAGRTATQVAADPVTLPTLAGTAYLFLTTADGPKFYYEELGTISDPIDNNGLVGKFEQYTTTEAEAYVIKGQSLVPAAVGSTVPANRAFVPVLSDIPSLTPAPARAGRLFFNVANTPTGLDMIEAADMKDGKMMIDGQLIIIRDGKMFNAQGAAL